MFTIVQIQVDAHTRDQCKDRLVQGIRENACHLVSENQRHLPWNVCVLHKFIIGKLSYVVFHKTLIYHDDDYFDN